MPKSDILEYDPGAIRFSLAAYVTDFGLAVNRSSSAEHEVFGKVVRVPKTTLATQGYESIRSEAVSESVVFKSKEHYLEPIRNRAFSILYRLTTVELQAGLSRLRDALPNESIMHTFCTTRTIARKGGLQ